MNILYLEDEPNEASLVERYVSVTPHHLTLVASLQEARGALDADFDLILADLRIGDARQGYEFIREIRSKGYGMTIIAVTGLNFPQDLEKCFEAGCNDVLVKPYTIRQLDAIIKKYTV